MATLVLALVSGCMGHSSATVRQAGAEKELSLRRTVTGILVGPCLAPVPGRSEEKWWIRLSGPGPVYAPADLAFLDEKGKVWPKEPGLTGSIRFDEAHHKVLVDLHADGEPLTLNGSYRYKVEE